MTVILTLYSRFGIVQVGDRLVTAKGAVVNPAANKTVIYAARDGIVSIGYTGLAALNGVPTDKWVAVRLGGTEPKAQFVLRNSKLPNGWTSDRRPMH
jgi:hypothetical protein